MGFDTKTTIYVGFIAINLAVAALVTLVLRARGVPDGPDSTLPEAYLAESDDVRVPEPEPALVPIDLRKT